MRILDCDAAAITVNVPACSSTNPALYSATLSSRSSITYALGVTLVPATGTSGMQLELVLPTPVPTKRGLWTLTVTTPCGCYNMPVWLNSCEPLSMLGTHKPTREPVVTYCVPTLQPDLAAEQPIVGLMFARSADGLRTGVDGLATPPYGSVTPPAPTNSVRLFITDSTRVLSGLITPTVPELEGQPWRLLDRHGRVVASGVATGSALSATLAAAPACGQHYLAFGAP